MISCVEPEDFKRFNCSKDNIKECLAENIVGLKELLVKWQEYKDCVNKSLGE